MVRTLSIVTVGRLLRSALFSAAGAGAAGSAAGAAGVAAPLSDPALTMMPIPDPPSPVPSWTSGLVFSAPVMPG